MKIVGDYLTSLQEQSDRFRTVIGWNVLILECDGEIKHFRLSKILN